LVAFGGKSRRHASPMGVPNTVAIEQGKQRLSSAKEETECKSSLLVLLGGVGFFVEHCKQLN
jgi:hypothetical protein